MSDQFLAEIRIFPLTYAPQGWAFCDGQVLSISQFTALFALVGTTYGGDGRTNFQLPNLQARVPLHVGGSQPGPGLSTYFLGEQTGVTTVTLPLTQIAAHTHSVMADPVPADLKAPATTAVLSRSSQGNVYLPPDNSVGSMAPNMIGLAGTGPGPHNNLMPSLTLNFCIAMSGIFPQRG